MRVAYYYSSSHAISLRTHPKENDARDARSLTGEEVRFRVNERSKRPEMTRMATGWGHCEPGTATQNILQHRQHAFVKVKMPSRVLVFHLSGLAYQVRQERSLRRLVMGKPTHDQVASEQSRIETTDAGGGDCKIQARPGETRQPAAVQRATVLGQRERTDYFSGSQMCVFNCCTIFQSLIVTVLFPGVHLSWATCNQILHAVTFCLAHVK